MQQTKVTK